MSDYRLFDAVEKLGPPPWRSDDPKLIEWEEAHGHDVRLKCYFEFGCHIAVERADRLEDAARAVVEAVRNPVPSDLTTAWVKVLEAAEACRKALDD